MGIATFQRDFRCNPFGPGHFVTGNDPTFGISTLAILRFALGVILFRLLGSCLDKRVGGGGDVFRLENTVLT